MHVTEVTEFAVSLPNRCGSLAELAGRLAARDINIEAFMLYTSFVVAIPDAPVVAGVCKLVLDREDEARSAFTEFGIPFREERVLLLRGPNQPGTLAKALQPLADAGVNVVDGYASILGTGTGDTSVVLAVSDTPKAVWAMKSASKRSSKGSS
jgi:hypothetical protein